MYFNSGKEDTNIDKEFNNKKGFNFKGIDFNKLKLPLIILGGILLLVIIIVILVNVFGGNNKKIFIQLMGDEYITLYKGDEYHEPGYKAYDNTGNNKTNDVVVDGDVDTSLIGEYVITYKLKNVKRERYVTVVERAVGATSIYLKGGMKIELKVGEEYKEPGYTVIDSVDSSLTDKVKVTSNVDTSKAGTYRVIYTVVNSSGVTTSEVREVIVK